MKRLFPILLCLLLLLSVPALAAELTFSDSDQISSADEVALLSDLGLLNGYTDGAFHPGDEITREQVAVICSVLIAPEPNSRNACPFADTANRWSASYVTFCHELGIVSGDGNDRFRPQDCVTARELAKMLLVAVGLDGSAFTGSDWAAAVDAQAAALGIYDGFYGGRGEPISRDDAALLLYNALSCYAVESYENGQPVYHLDSLMNPQTLLEYRFGVTRYEELLVANEYADLTEQDGKLEPGQTRIEHHRAFQVSTDAAMLGRYVVIYAADDGTVVGVPTRSLREVYYTFSSMEEYRTLTGQTGYRVTGDTRYYLDYNAASAGDLTDDRISSVTLVDHTNDGKIDIVLALSLPTEEAPEDPEAPELPDA